MAGIKDCISFENNRLLAELFGPEDQHLNYLEEKLHITLSTRGNVVAITGEDSDVEAAKTILQSFYEKLESGGNMTLTELEATIRYAEKKNERGDVATLSDLSSDTLIKTLRKSITPYSENQKFYMEALFKKEVVIASGPAGTGKTYLAVAAAVSKFLTHKVDRIILCRPAVEAGEKLGFLPGDMKEKVDPYLRPLYDALYEMIPAEKVMYYLENGLIEIAPLAFMRGRTLNNAAVIFDEAQNCTPTQMKMFLTRLGEGSQMVVCGDMTQTDLPKDVPSGLRDALDRLCQLKEIGCIAFDEGDIVRHSLTAKIVHAYEAKL